MIKILQVTTVEREVTLLDFINSRSVYFEFIDKHDTCYIPDPAYPSEEFILILQEVDAGELSYHEIGYVLCPNQPEDFYDLKEYVIEHIDEFVSLDV